MTRIVLSLALLIGLALPAAAECFADYTASRSNPYDLHYGVAEIGGACTVASAQQQLQGRLANAGWQLLEVRATFDRAGAEARRANAGEYYLLY